MAISESVGTTTAGAPVDVGERKPLMSAGNILLMNLGFFGVQFSFGLTQSAVNPLFTLIGASPEQLPILNIAGPITGLLIQPMIGAISDRTWHPRWGRRGRSSRPARSYARSSCSCSRSWAALWVGVLCLWLLDIGNNTSMEPYRAFISDRLPKS